MEPLSEIIRRQRFVIEQGCHMRDSLIIVLEGKFCCAIGGEDYTAGPYDICVFPKGVPFARKVLSPLRCVHLQFENFPWSLPAGLLALPDPARGESTIDYLARAVEARDAVRTEHYLQDLYLMSQPVQHTPDIRDEAVSRCITYINECFMNIVSLEELAEREALSKQTLIRKFKDCTGMTPMQYLAAVRLNESKILLRDTDLTVGSIAQNCGFENVYYFSNSFRKHTGLTPTQYRKNNRL